MTPAEVVHYGLTKTALLAVTRGFAKAARGTGVTVSSVIVGPTHTTGVEDFARELVGDLAWTDLASATTGGAVPADGGYVDSILP